MPDLMQPAWFIPLFLIFCYGGIVLVSNLAGWSALARTLGAQGVPAGDSYRFITVTLGSRMLPMRYRRCARLVFNAQGFYVGLMFPFNIGSPALFIPWVQVESCDEEQFLNTRSVTFVFKDQWSQLKLRGPIGQIARAAWLQALGRPGT